MNPRCFASDANWLLYQFAFGFQVAMAPSLYDRLRSGMTRSGSNSRVTPRPEHSEQAPAGLLNENSDGSRSGTLR